MLYATKSNIQLKIDDDQADVYAKQGYKIMDKDGNPIESSYHEPVPYEEHIKALEAAKSAKVKELEAKIKVLEAKLKEATADDFE